MTSVVSVRGQTPAEWLAIPGNIYVGRGMPYQGWKAAPFGNPFKPGMTPEMALNVFTSIPQSDRLGYPEAEMDFTWTLLDCFEAYVRARRSLWERLPELRGCNLGCWCLAKSWTPERRIKLACHAQVAAILAEGLDPADYREPKGLF